MTETVDVVDALNVLSFPFATRRVAVVSSLTTSVKDGVLYKLEPRVVPQRQKLKILLASPIRYLSSFHDDLLMACIPFKGRPCRH